MNIDRHVVDLQQRLASAAALIGTEEAQDLTERLAGSLDAGTRLVIMDALSSAAAEITTALAPGSVDVRLRDGEPEFVVDLDIPDTTPATPAPGPLHSPVGPTVTPPDTTGIAGASGAADLNGNLQRTTIRLPQALKDQAEEAAARDGVSLNTWLVRAVGAAVNSPPLTRSAVPTATFPWGAAPFAGSPTADPSKPGTQFTGWAR
ncbi:MAG: toxin-antitoxin system HicB family antitoxin [Cellulomonadaceae bacterium]|nr:toxin-antitoxin system HicB family antitoxin [Cellulomonadaceae bacterium]